MPIRVLHVGNDLDGGGGIAGVIRQHLTREPFGIAAAHLCSYHQNQPDMYSKNRSLFRALRTLLWRPLDAQVIHVHVSHGGSIYREGLLLVVASFRRPTIVTVHGSDIMMPGVLKGLHRMVFRILIRRSATVHVYSHRYAEALRIPTPKWIVVPNDVASTRVQWENKREVAVFAGEVGYRKGADVLLAAWALLDPTEWDLILAGPLVGIEGLTESLPTSVQLLGELPHADVIELFESAKLCIQPSRAEAFPVSVCEAMMAGCAVIGTNVGALGELLLSSRQSVVSPLTPMALCEALRSMIGDGVIVDRGRDARVFAQRNLSREAVSPVWFAEYEKLISATRKKATPI